MGSQNFLKRICDLINKKKRDPYKGKLGNKRRKLDEASYFFNCMVLNEHKTGLFQFNYSAFLTAARSVLQYAHEEVNPDCNPNAKQGALKWYQKAVAKSKVIKFGRKERDENIHWAPVIPNNSVTVVPNAIEVTKESNIAVLRGSRLLTITQRPEAELPEPSPPAEVFYTYTSSRWEGPEDLLRVCRMYLDELEALVKDGISKGYITWLQRRVVEVDLETRTSISRGLQ